MGAHTCTLAVQAVSYTTLIDLELASSEITRDLIPSNTPSTGGGIVAVVTIGNIAGILGASQRITTQGVSRIAASAGSTSRCLLAYSAVGNSAVKSRIGNALVGRIHNIVSFAQLAHVATEPTLAISHLHSIIRETGSILEIVPKIAELALRGIAGLTPSRTGIGGSTTETAAIARHVEGAIADGTDIGLVAGEAVGHRTVYHLAVGF